MERKSLNEYSVAKSLNENIRLMDFLFANVDITLSRRFKNRDNPDVEYCIYFTDGVVNSAVINDHIVEPLILATGLSADDTLFESIKDCVVMINDTKQSDSVAKIVDAVTYGDTVLFVNGCDKALILSTKMFTLRGVGEPEGEKTISGPREGFTEGLMINLSLLRRRMRTPDLKLKMSTIGTRTKTSVCVAYMDGIVNKEVLDELEHRLEQIDIDGVLDSNYIVEYVSPKSKLGFSTCGTTERPDVISAALLEGRVALFVDGSPVAVTFPYLFVENFQSREDYYVNPIYSSFNRLLRIACYILASLVPSVYVSIVAYHHEVLPSALLSSLAQSSSRVPLPAALECLIMLLVFDILREAGVRVPSHLGQALSIAGAIVIGQAAVEAGLVSAPVVVVVAFSGIAILLIPAITTPCLIAKYSCLAAGSMLGLTGVIISGGIILVHILALESMGIPSLSNYRRIQYQNIKDSVFRGPWPTMLNRPKIAADTKRAKNKKKRGE